MQNLHHHILLLLVNIQLGKTMLFKKVNNRIFMNQTLKLNL